jgi:predicted  nucleic acid-binding Zn-ribbon protein
MASNVDAQYLLSLKKKITAARDTGNRLQGSLDTMVATMKKEYGIETTDGAERRIAMWEKKIAELQVELHAAVEKIREKYDA